MLTPHFLLLRAFLTIMFWGKGVRGGGGEAPSPPGTRLTGRTDRTGHVFLGFGGGKNHKYNVQYYPAIMKNLQNLEEKRGEKVKQL